MSALQRSRVIVLGVAFGLLTVVVAARLYQLQVLDRAKLRAMANRQHHRIVEVPATRGDILDRHGRALAVSLATQALYAHPSRVEDPAAVARALAPILGLGQRELVGRLTADRSFVWLERFLEPEQVEAVRALGLAEPPAFGFLPSSKRHYPHGQLGVHVIGFSDIDSKGLEGVERQLDRALSGEPTTYLVLQDARRGGVREVVGATPRQPHDVVLTLDLELQHLLERELDAALRTTGAAAGSAILLDPRNGQLLGLANRPTFDPNRYSRSKPEQRCNRAVVAQFEPGSTFKIVPMAAALDAGRVRPGQRFDCEDGSYTVDGRRIRDSKPHGVLSATEVLERSSNIGMVKITRRLEPTELFGRIVGFGFGEPTGVELPGEIHGLVPPLEGWDPYTADSLAFGQGISVTALQMALALATVANDGVRVPPRVILGRIDSAGRFLPEPSPVGRRVISQRAARELTSMLEGVIRSGTGRAAAVAGYRVAGKSGTAQKPLAGGYSETDFVASFGGFGPLPEPRLVALVVLDGPRYGRHHGGPDAGPAFAAILREALAELRIPGEGPPLVTRRAAPGAAPATPAVWSRTPDAGAPRRSTEAAARMPDLAGSSLREALRALAAGGCPPEVEGHGVVVSQSPAAGTELRAGARCRIRLAPPRSGGGTR